MQRPRTVVMVIVAILLCLAAAYAANGQSALPPPSNAQWVDSYVNQVVNPYVQCWSTGYFYGTVCFPIGNAFACGLSSSLTIGESYETTLEFGYGGAAFTYCQTYEVQQNFGPHTAGPDEKCQFYVCYQNAAMRKWTCLRQFSFWTWTTTDYTFAPGDTGTVIVHCEPYPCVGRDTGSGGGEERGGCCGGGPENTGPGTGVMFVDLNNYFTTTGTPPPVHPISNPPTKLSQLNRWQKSVIHHQVHCISMLEGVQIIELVVQDQDYTHHHFDLLANPNPFNLPLAPQLETFDTYAAGSQVHGQGGWRGFNNNPAAGALVSAAQARSSPHSVDVTGATDLVHDYCTNGKGDWIYSAWQYIPSTFTSGGTGATDGSFFLLANTQQLGGPYHVSVQMQFDSNDGQCKVLDPDAPGGVSSVAYATDRWAQIEVVIDLDHDWVEVYYDGSLVADYMWTGGVLGDGGSTTGTGGGALDVAGVNLYARGSSSIYYDDLSFLSVNLCPADLNNDDTVNVADLLAMLTAWGPNPGHPADLTGDGNVDVADLLQMLTDWGSC